MSDTLLPMDVDPKIEIVVKKDGSEYHFTMWRDAKGNLDCHGVTVSGAGLAVTKKQAAILFDYIWSEGAAII